MGVIQIKVSQLTQDGEKLSTKNLVEEFRDIWKPGSRATTKKQGKKPISQIGTTPLATLTGSFAPMVTDFTPDFRANCRTASLFLQRNGDEFLPI